MNESLTSLEPLVADLPAPTPVRPLSLHARLVVAALRKMQAGCLRLTMPDGTVHIMGTPGSEVSASLRVVRPAFFEKCVLFGDIGFGESYVDGDWETDSVKQVLSWVILNIDRTPGASGSRARGFALNLLQLGNRLRHLLRPNSVETSRRNIAEHYDLGNEFYRLWLDPTMTYSSALFTARGQSLESAQHAKYDRLCRQLQLQPTDHVLEIGCGWGGFGAYAARNYGCRITGVTISAAQYEYAIARMQWEGLANRVEIKLEDYRKLTGTFDKVVSIEMMEALGDRYLPAFCKQVDRLLKPHGLAALHYITVPDGRFTQLRRGVDFIQKHIFPGSLLLSIGRVGEALSRAGDLFLHDLTDLGSSYARTLACWRENFQDCLPEVRALGFDDRFIRKWDYYLQYCEAAFAQRNISVVQALYTRPNNPALHEDFAA